jgi:hypothetical protein
MAGEYLASLPKELLTPSRQRQQAAMLGNLGDVLVSWWLKAGFRLRLMLTSEI